jgi:hypothetical protein
MASQTIIGHFVLGVTVHTPSHRHLDEGLRWGSLTSTHISVTALTLNLPENDMASVGKEDVVGFLVQPFPGDLFPLFVKLPDLFLFRTFRNGFFMTIEAHGGVGYAGKCLGFVKTVTGVTLQSLFEMLFVIERNRLCGLGAKT